MLKTEMPIHLYIHFTDVELSPVLLSSTAKETAALHRRLRITSKPLTTDLERGNPLRGVKHTRTSNKNPAHVGLGRPAAS